MAPGGGRKITRERLLGTRGKEGVVENHPKKHRKTDTRTIQSGHAGGGTPLRHRGGEVVVRGGRNVGMNSVRERHHRGKARL